MDEINANSIAETVETAAVETTPADGELNGLLNYEISVVAPEELNALQVALYNGSTLIGAAVNVENGTATIVAPAGDYTVKVFGLPDDDYKVSAELLSAEKHEAKVVIDYCEDFYIINDRLEASEDGDDEMVDYKIFVIAPEELKSLQVALYNGDNQAGEAVNVENGQATISAPARDYYVKVFCLPDDDYIASVELLSATEREATVTITYCIDYYDIGEGEDEEEVEEEEEQILTVTDVIEDVRPELVEYKVVVEAPENLSAIQIALYNGDAQIGLAADVVDGAATVNAEAGDYTVKVLGLSEDEYKVEAELLSETKLTTTVIVTAVVREVVEEMSVSEATAAPERDPLIIEEESFEGGLLRYDRSFKARLIQSDNDVKNWYTELKNELLSFKKVKDRLSWKRESYNLGRSPVARLSFRGNTLCLYLPLDPAAYAESKYKVESIEDNGTYADTPCLYRIKNDRRVKYAKELITAVMENLDAKRIERNSVDYYEPYEGLVQLINKGLIKRVIKDKASEAFFTEKKENDTL